MDTINWNEVCKQCPYKTNCDFVSRVCDIDSDRCDEALEMYLDEQIDEENGDV